MRKKMLGVHILAVEQSSTWRVFSGRWNWTVRRCTVFCRFFVCYALGPATTSLISSHWHVGLGAGFKLQTCRLRENGFREDSKRKYEILQCKLIKQNTHTHKQTCFGETWISPRKRYCTQSDWGWRLVTYVTWRSLVKELPILQRKGSGQVLWFQEGLVVFNLILASTLQQSNLAIFVKSSRSTRTYFYTWWISMACSSSTVCCSNSASAV